MATELIQKLFERAELDEDTPLTWTTGFAGLSSIGLIIAVGLASVFLASLFIYGITAYLGPAIFRTGPWKRSADEEVVHAAASVPYPYMAGYGRIINPFMTELTAKVTKAVAED